VPNGSAASTSVRLLQLLSLLQARRQWSGPDLARRTGVTERTVRRDMERLRDLGYPVTATPGVAGGYRLEHGTALPPLLLDDDEALAVAVALATSGAGVTGLEEAGLRALTKLEQVLPARLRPRLADAKTAFVRLPDHAATVDPAVLSGLASACRDEERVRFDYVDGTGGASTRRVEPHRVVHNGRRWYLVAFDLDRSEWRTFRVDRVAAFTRSAHRFVPRDPPDAVELVARATTSAPYPHQARVRLHAPVGVVAQQIPPTVGALEADGETCVLTVGANSLDTIAVHLALLDVDVEVIEPPELAERLGRMARRLSYRPGEPSGHP
jgi:predicted DNA-binding transcriptional regulator YafY